MYLSLDIMMSNIILRTRNLLILVNMVVKKQRHSNVTSNFIKYEYNEQI